MKTPQPDKPEDPKSNSKTPPKKKKPRKKKEPIESKEFILSNPEDMEMLKELLSAEMDPKALEQYNKRSNIENDMKAVNAVLTEHLSSFLVLGYALDGTRITLKFIKTERDEDALIEQLRYIFLKTMGE